MSPSFAATHIGDPGLAYAVTLGESRLGVLARLDLLNLRAGQPGMRMRFAAQRCAVPDSILAVLFGGAWDDVRRIHAARPTAQMARVLRRRAPGQKQYRHMHSNVLSAEDDLAISTRVGGERMQHTLVGRLNGKLRERVAQPGEARAVLGSYRTGV